MEKNTGKQHFLPFQFIFFFFKVTKTAVIVWNWVEIPVRKFLCLCVCVWGGGGCPCYCWFQRNLSHIIETGRLFGCILIDTSPTSEFEPNDKFFRLVQIESICRRQTRCNLKIEILLGMGRKHCEKRRKCWLPGFSPLPTMFSKSIFFGVVKSRMVW